MKLKDLQTGYYRLKYDNSGQLVEAVQIGDWREWHWESVIYVEGGIIKEKPPHDHGNNDDVHNM